ncbi:haloacid dehalogenase type II, partial [Klebsiella pneumoniae]|nr:haloacid dehalogenase type II [Klebsiella pneumoniae]
VIGNALERTAKKWGVEYKEEYGEAIYQAVPGWGPHPDVPAGLARIGDKIPLVILSNAMNSQIHQNVAKLGAPFYQVHTAESAQA